MTKSQAIALRCAANIPKRLLQCKWTDIRREKYMIEYGIRNPHHLPNSLMDQLDRCADDEARRILLGMSQ